MSIEANAVEAILSLLLFHLKSCVLATSKDPNGTSP